MAEPFLPATWKKNHYLLFRIIPSLRELVRNDPAVHGVLISALPCFNSLTDRSMTGDAIWVPTWTWHRVDYDTESDHESSDRGSISLGASLFHFRPIDFVRNNPLFAVLMVPAMVLEVLGIKTQ